MQSGLTLPKGIQTSISEPQSGIAGSRWKDVVPQGTTPLDQKFKWHANPLGRDTESQF